jgi:tetratricopeptide (TPR) repeat protein
MSIFYSPLSVICLVLCSLSVQAEINIDNLADFIEKDGRADSRSIEVKQAQRIFEKLREAAPTPSKGSSDLLVTNKHERLMAAAVKDGIVLSQYTIKFCYENVSQTVGDARLAFVLGHELAHQVHPDSNESSADKNGFLYAALAGYSMATLVESGKDFFTHWYQSQAEAMRDLTHDTPTKRAETLQKELKKILTELVYFKFGTRLAHFGRYQDAQYFLKRFQLVFKSPETLNNLGYIQLQLALEKMSEQHSGYIDNQMENLPYCLPVMLDMNSHVDTLGFPSVEVFRSASAESQSYFESAAKHFKDATELETDYAPAWLNWAVTEFYLGNYSKSSWLAEEATKRLSNNNTPNILKALITLKQGENIDTWPNALRILQTIADKPQTTACDLYNTAVLLSQRKRAEAQTYWKKLYAQSDNFSNHLRLMICADKPCVTQTATPFSLDMQTPITAGEFLTKRRRLLKSWHSKSFKFNSKIEGLIYQSADHSVEILAFSGENGSYADMLVLKPDANINLKQAKQACSIGLKHQPYYGKQQLWSCRTWAVLTENEQVKEAWVVPDVL